MADAVLSIGSNVGDRLANLQVAADAMGTWLRAVSPVYETSPWGPVPQDDFLNAVLLVTDPDADGAEWLRRAVLAEQAAARTRDLRWGPRTLDVDIVAVDGERSDDPVLTLPHPRAAERAFVLVPWSDVDPTAGLDGVPVRDLARRLPGDVRRRDDLVLRRRSAAT